WHIHQGAVAPIHGFQSTMTLQARAVAQNANLPYAVVALQDKPANSQYHNLNISASTAVLGLQGGGGPSARGGVFSNAGIDPGNGIPAITFSPAGNAGDRGAVNVQGTLRTLTNADLPISGCGQTLTSGADLGAIVEIKPDNFGGSTRCDKNPFTVGSSATFTLTPSLNYFNINVYIETYSAAWQTVCTTQPLGTNVLQFSSGACYNISGAIYGPADNM